MSEAKPNVYETCDPAYLQNLRIEVGMDVVQLARTACLSVAQVKSLEEGRSDLFYSAAIKRQAYKRILMILGAPPPVAIIFPKLEPVVSQAEQPQQSQQSQQVQPLQSVQSVQSVQPVQPVQLAPVNESLNQIADLTTQPVDDWLSRLTKGLGVHRQKGMVLALAAAVTLGAVAALYTKQGHVLASLTTGTTPATMDESVRAPVAQDEGASVAVDVRPMPVAVASEPVAVASEPEHAASAAAVSEVRPDSVCAYSSDPGPMVSSATPQKEGRFVHLVGLTDATFCVVDAKKQASILNLKAGEGRSIYGVAPWQVSGNNLAQVQIYFQGWRVALPEGVVSKVVLVEKAFTP